jgi:hypothetical protein
VQKNSETADRPRMRHLVHGIGAVLFSAMLGVSAPALAEHGGGGFHGGGFHGGGFHGFHGGRFGVAGFHGAHFHFGGFHHHAFNRFHGGFGYGFYPGLGLGLGFGFGYPWYWNYYPPYYGYYGGEIPYASTTYWYYCSNPAGYYPYVTRCYGTWQAVPAS